MSGDGHIGRICSGKRGCADIGRRCSCFGTDDPSFTGAGAEAYRTDVPDGHVHLLRASHFAMDEAANDVAELTAAFLWLLVHPSMAFDEHPWLEAFRPRSTG